MLGGQLGDRYGGELVLWTSALVWGSSVFSISLVASISNSLVFIAHLMNGLSQGKGGRGEEGRGREGGREGGKGREVRERERD